MSRAHGRTVKRPRNGEIWRLSNRRFDFHSESHKSQSREEDLNLPFTFNSSPFHDVNFSSMKYLFSITNYNVSNRIYNGLFDLCWWFFLLHLRLRQSSNHLLCFVFRLFHFTSEKKKNDSPITEDNCPHFGANKLLLRLLDFPIKSIYCLPTFLYVELPVISHVRDEKTAIEVVYDENG